MEKDREEVKQLFREVVQAARLETEHGSGNILVKKGYEVELSKIKVTTCTRRLGRNYYNTSGKIKLGIKWDAWNSRSSEYKMMLLLHEASHFIAPNHKPDEFWVEFRNNLRTVYRNRDELDSWSELDWSDVAERVESDVRPENVYYNQTEKALEKIQPAVNEVRQSFAKQLPKGS